MLPDFMGTNFSLFFRELRDPFNFRSQFLKFGVMELILMVSKAFCLF